MKILLVNPNWTLHELRFTMAVTEPHNILPLEFAYIAGGIDKNKHQVVAIDAFAERLSWEALSKRIKSIKPDICVVSTAPTYLFWRCCPLDLEVPIKTIKVIKESSSSKIIVFGPHGSITPSYAFDTLNCDFLILGEPDIVVTDLINNNLKLPEGIKGVKTKEREADGYAFVKNLDDIAFPELEIFSLDIYEPHIWNKPMKQKIKDRGGRFILAESSRGCYKGCFFCQRSKFRGLYREKSADRMKREIDYYSKLGIKYIYFIDETGSTYSTDKGLWLEYLSNFDIKWGAQCIIDQTDKKLIDLFKKSGCIYLEYGLETENAYLRKLMRKNMDLSKLEYAKKTIQKVITFRLNFYSHDYFELLKMSFDEIDESAVFERPIKPFPGSPLGIMLLRKYGIKDDQVWNFVLRYTWWLEIEYVLISKRHKNKGFSKETYKKEIAPNFKKMILFGDFETVKEITYAFLEMSGFWEVNSKAIVNEN